MAALILASAVLVGLAGTVEAQSGMPRLSGTGPTSDSPPAEPPTPTAGASQKHDDRSVATEDSALALSVLEIARAISGNSVRNWAIFFGATFLGVVGGRLVASLLQFFALRLARRGWAHRGRVIADLAGPAHLLLIALGVAAGLTVLAMSPALRSFCSKTLLLLYTIAVFWYAYNLVGVMDVFVRRVATRGRGGLDEAVVNQLAPLLRRSLRAFLVVVGGLFVAQSVFDQNIGALLAGLGLAGLAVSLAAQDSLKNVFGSLTILFDRPFQLGERIVYGGYDGVIEEIGFRSTKLRTLTGHLVTIPNSLIVSSAVENIGRRPTIRRLIDLGVPYDTPRDKVEQAVAILRSLLEEEGLREPIHPTVGRDEFPPRVFFNEFNPDSLNIRVIYWYAPPDYWAFMEHAQRLNLRIMEEFEKAGIEFAFPSRTLYLAGDRRRQLSIEVDTKQPAGG